MTTAHIPPTEVVEYTQGAIKKATAGMTSADLWKCPVDSIVVDPDFNVRIHDKSYDDRVRAIADSIKANGYYPDRPLAGFVAKAEDGSDIIILTDGHRRLAAVKLAISEGCEITEVPMVTKPRGTSMEDLTVALVTSNDGDQLSPYEVALVCKRLVNIGMDSKTISSRIGRTKVYVENLLDLVAAPKAIRDMVVAGKVSATLAVETLRKDGKDALTSLKAAQGVAESVGKTKVTKKHVKAATGDKKKPPAKTKAQRAATQEAPTQQSLLPVNGAELLERVAGWIEVRPISEDERKVLKEMLMHVTGLTDVEISPYLEDGAL
jgi:ParB family transcriptional regulator, chromosome partitioning protein